MDLKPMRAATSVVLRLPLPLRLLSNSKSAAPEPTSTLTAQPESQPPRQSHPFVHILTNFVNSVVAADRQPPPTPTNPLMEAGCSLPRFRPYVAKVPWHGGARALLSGLFPRYGHYCGPNWSSGKAGGSMLWDRRPIDWLDFCCYCHDIGYDTHDQQKLLMADLAFLDCLERPRMATKGGAHVALVYRSMCIAGLRNVLIPYRMQLVRLKAQPIFEELRRNLAGRWKWNTSRQA